MKGVTNSNEFSIYLNSGKHIYGKPIFTSGCLGIIPSPYEEGKHIILGEDDTYYQEICTVDLEELRIIHSIFYIMSTYVTYNHSTHKYKFPRGRRALFGETHYMGGYKIDVEKSNDGRVTIYIEPKPVEEGKLAPYKHSFAMSYLKGYSILTQAYIESINLFG